MAAIIFEIDNFILYTMLITIYAKEDLSLYLCKVLQT